MTPADLPTRNAPETIEDALRWSAWAARAVALGQIDARTCREISYACSQVRYLVSASELQARVRELERQLREALKGKTKR